MTGRVCPVHGEWCPTGVCRWCEKPSGADQSTITLPLMCICKTCLRGFDAPVPLTSLECPDCRAAARVANVDVAPPLTGKMILEAMNRAWVRIIRARLQDDAIEATHLAFSPEECGQSLLAEHAVLRWERVARRWEGKHRRTLLDVAKQWQTKWNFDLKCALRILERHNPLLQDAPWKEPKR